MKTSFCSNVNAIYWWNTLLTFYLRRISLIELWENEIQMKNKLKLNLVNLIKIVQTNLMCRSIRLITQLKSFSSEQFNMNFLFKQDFSISKCAIGCFVNNFHYRFGTCKAMCFSSNLFLVSSSQWGIVWWKLSPKRVACEKNIVWL